jgi:hypothetical protein
LYYTHVPVYQVAANLTVELIIQVTRWARPTVPVPAAYADVEAENDPVLLLREPAVPDVRPEVVEPPEAAALAAPLQTCLCARKTSIDTIIDT